MFGLIVVRRKIASLFADLIDIKRTAFWKCGAVRVLWFDIFVAFVRSPVFGSPAFWGLLLFKGIFGIGLSLLCDLLTPGGFSPPSTPRKRLARRLTPRFLISRYALVKISTFAPRSKFQQTLFFNAQKS